MTKFAKLKNVVGGISTELFPWLRACFDALDIHYIILDLCIKN